MKSRGDPPPEKGVGWPRPNDQPLKSTSGAGKRFCSENTDPAPGSQSHPASIEEAAGILSDRLPEYHHYESSDWSDGHNWRLNQATPKQVECLRKFGIDARGANLGHASRLITTLIRRKQKGLASFSDVRWLFQHGVENAQKLTAAQAQALIEIISYEQTEVHAQRPEGGAE